MKHFYFVVCFGTGVSLMIFSGYLPQSASALSSPAALDGGLSTYSSYPRKVTRPLDGVLPEQVEATPVAAAGSPLDAPPPEVADAQPAPAPAIESPPERALPGRAPAADPVYTYPSPQVASAAPAASTRESASPAPVVAGETVPRPADAADPGPFDLEQLKRQAVESAQGGAAPSRGDVESIRPVANAGAGKVVWAGWDELPLDASASRGGTLTYHWRQVSGPALLIRDEGLPVTVATGVAALVPSWRPVTCRFEVKVTDEQGVEAKATVQHTIRFAPALRIKPVAQRRFELRDGYNLAHFVAWTTNVESGEHTFELAADGEVSFTKLGGGVYVLAGGKSEAGFTYYLTLYAQPDEPASWVELLVDGEDHVPGIVQLGVNWVRPAPAGPVE